MKMHDINPSEEKVVLLIHPMLADADLLGKLLCENMGNNYRYLIPDLSGHGEASESDFESAEKEAEDITAYIKEKGIDKIELAFGASLGGAVLLEIADKGTLNIRRLLFEGTPLFENAGFLNFFISRIMIKKHRKAISNPPDRNEYKMGLLFGDEAKKIMAETMVNISEKSIKNISFACSHVKLPKLSEEMQKNTVFAYGEKDADLKPAKKKLPEKYPLARLKVWDGKGHCEKITSDKREYAKMIADLINE